MQNGMVNFIAKLKSVSEDDGCCAIHPSRPQIKYLDLGNASSWDDSALPITKRLSIISTPQAVDKRSLRLLLQS